MRRSGRFLCWLLTKANGPLGRGAAVLRLREKGNPTASANGRNGESRHFMTYPLNTMAAYGLKLRIVVAARVALCWFFGIALAALFGSEGFWLANSHVCRLAAVRARGGSRCCCIPGPHRGSPLPLDCRRSHDWHSGWRLVAGLAGALFATVTTLPAAAAFIGSSKVRPFSGIATATEPQTDLP